jgi:hypothetical protein
MILIGELYARYSSTLAESELPNIAERAFVFAESTSQAHYGDRYARLGISTAVRIDIGSTRTWISIFAVSALNLFIGYGGIRQSIEYARKDIDNLARNIFPKLPELLGMKDTAPEYHAHRLGFLRELEKLFVEVKEGDLAVEAATAQAMLLLKKHGVLDEIEDSAILEKQLSVEFEAMAQDKTPQHYLIPTIESSGTRKSERRPRALPEPSHPMLAQPPGSPTKRRRKRVMAMRDPNTGNFQVFEY